MYNPGRPNGYFSTLSILGMSILPTMVNSNLMWGVIILCWEKVMERSRPSAEAITRARDLVLRDQEVKPLNILERRVDPHLPMTYLKEWTLAGKESAAEMR